MKTMNYGEREGPDTGWSWVVAFAASFTTIIIIGIFRIYGLLLVAFTYEFNVPREAASWPLVLYTAVFKLSGIIAGPLSYQYGVRPVSMVGSIVATSGLVVCYCVTTLDIITFFFGVIYGLGSGVVYTLMPIVINQYFLKYRTTAMGIALSGAGIGTLILPPIHVHLMNNYGLKGYFLLIGGIMLQTIVSGALMRPPPWIKTSKNGTKQTMKKFKSRDSCKHVISGKSSNFDSQSCSTQQKEKVKSQTINLVYLKDNVAESGSISCSKDQTSAVNVTVKPDTGLKVKCYQNSNPASKSVAPQNEKQLIENFNHLKNEMQTNSFQGIQCNGLYENFVPENSKTGGNFGKACRSNFTTDKYDENIYKNSDGNAEDRFDVLHKINSHSEHAKVSNNHKLVTENKEYLSDFPAINNFKENVDTLRNKNPVKNYTHNVIQRDIQSSLNMIQSIKVILKSPMFHITSISNAGCYSILLVYIIIVVDFATDRGVTEEESKYILFAFAISDFVGRLCFGWITDKKYMRRPHYVMMTMTATALLFFIYPFVYGLVMHACFTCMYGVLSGCTVVVFPVLLAEYVGKEMQDIAIGFMNFFNGAVMLIWPSIIGYFRDTLGSYSIMFYILGAMAFSTGILWLLEKCFTKEQKALTNNHSVENHS